MRAGAFLLVAVLASATTAANAAAPAAPPHIFMLLIDDYGWANIGFHSPNSSEVVTPNLDALASSGVILERHYVHKFCRCGGMQCPLEGVLQVSALTRASTLPAVPPEAHFRRAVPRFTSTC